MEDMYTVGEVSEITGIEKRKLKYYIERGIIVPSCKKSEGGKSYWLYSKDDIMKIRQIALYKELGYSNSKIHKMLSDPDFDFVEDLYKRIDSMKTERRQMENRIYVAEMIRYFYETEEDQARLDISDFGNDIDGEVEGMFSGFLTELENDTSTPESGGLNINDNEALADRVNSLLEKYDSLRRAMRAPADSGELEHYIEEMTADFNSMSKDKKADLDILIMMFRLIANTTMDRVADIYFEKKGAFDLLLDTLSKVCNEKQLQAEAEEETEKD